MSATYLEKGRGRISAHVFAQFVYLIEKYHGIAPTHSPQRLRVRGTVVEGELKTSARCWIVV